MVPKVIRGYAIWWQGVHPTGLGMDEEDEEKWTTMSEGSFEDDPYLFNNIMHNIPMQEQGAASRLTALAEAIVLGKKTNHICNFKI